MSRLIDLIGKRFGRLIVVRRMNNNKWGQSRWLCLCNCGEELIVSNTHLRSGSVQSCGCLNIERLTKHGCAQRGRRSRAYLVWNAMIQRCTNSNHKQWKNYGGRGIIVCDRWKEFPNFLEDMGEALKGLQLDRINNNKGYYKKNCRWATRKQQNRNKRNNHLITFNGETRCLIEWSEKIGVNSKTISKRLSLDWSIDEIMTTPTIEHRDGK